MAQRTIQLDQEKLSCSICLQLLKHPVTIPCGHSYCMDCIKNYWDEKETHSCPQCREIFTPRPVLVKNTMLAELVEDLKKVEHLTASPDHAYPGPGDVACSGRKRKASKSCLMCMAFYCEHHLQPHYNVAPIKRHKIIKATSKLRENICPRHDEEMKIFCCTDQQCVCCLCLMDEHKDHVTVSPAVERAEKQKRLGRNRQKFLQRIQEREKDVKMLRRRGEAINLSADKAFRECDKAFKDLISLIEKKNSEGKQKIRSKQKAEQDRVKELQDKIEQEIRDLRRRDTALQQLSLTEDHLHFLKNYSSLSHLSASTNVPTYNNLTLQYFEDVTPSVSRTRDKHLQPHYNVVPLKKHKLIDATSKLQENICPHHDEVMKIFCRTDQQCICYLCLIDEHKDHVTVSAAAERVEKQKELETNRQNVQQRIQNRRKDVKVLQEQVEAISLSSDNVLRQSAKMFQDLISLIEKKSSEVKQKIKSKQKFEQNRVKELQEKIEQERH
ncbi:E3 ubiquitin/ISG15 ligase TRIM25-like [Pundamilia nyererei]|uniref:E3 ubiquitin/ISG15 ligase TRIM25-like n=1 Tax=Pundamilia nyererei TaxID=303518 RepID=A0A9Y3VWD8_9CICH|nr:PREDICTED: E3 ubiquitin/ISG15 ligase TRIM25-like [Pundamilia nyererei]